MKLQLSESYLTYWHLIIRDCPLMFSIRAKQRPIPSISASDSSKFQFYICFQSFQPDFLSVFHDEDTSPPQEIRLDPFDTISLSRTHPTPSETPTHPNRLMKRFKKKTANQNHKNLNNTPPLTQLPQPKQKAPQTTRTTKLPSRRLRSMPMQTDHLQDTCQ